MALKKNKHRIAHLLLHRKIACEHFCICGSEMVHTPLGYVCRRQMRLKEPKSIEVTIKDKPLVVRG